MNQTFKFEKRAKSVVNANCFNTVIFTLEFLVLITNFLLPFVLQSSIDANTADIIVFSLSLATIVLVVLEVIGFLVQLICGSKAVSYVNRYRHQVQHDPMISKLKSHGAFTLSIGVLGFGRFALVFTITLLNLLANPSGQATSQPQSNNNNFVLSIVDLVYALFLVIGTWIAHSISKKNYWKMVRNNFDNSLSSQANPMTPFDYPISQNNGDFNPYSNPEVFADNSNNTYEDQSIDNEMINDQNGIFEEPNAQNIPPRPEQPQGNMNPNMPQQSFNPDSKDINKEIIKRPRQRSREELERLLGPVIEL